MAASASARRAGVVALALAVGATLAGCGAGSPADTPVAARPSPGPDCGSAVGEHFTVDPVSATEGAPDPRAAAEAFIRDGVIWSSPPGPWRVVEVDGSAATVAAEGTVLQAHQGPDGTWQVLSGSRCR